MKKPSRFVVGLTGGIGAGKSCALREFERLGAGVVSLDQLAREQARRGREGWRAIVKAFGRAMLDAEENIDREKLGAAVFGDAAKRRKLERVTHPSILRELSRITSRLRGVVVVDVPLLFEKRLQGRFDATLLIACPPAEQVRRVCRRDGLTPAQARRRLKAQWSPARKRARADLTIDNDRTLAVLRQNVRKAYAGLSLLYGGTPNGNAD